MSHMQVHSCLVLWQLKEAGNIFLQPVQTQMNAHHSYKLLTGHFLMGDSRAVPDIIWELLEGMFLSTCLQRPL